MIDWVTCVISCNHDPEKLQGGRVFSMSPTGEIEWHVDKRRKVEGSHSSRVDVLSNTDTKIYISGNPVKFLQGHNIFGTDDLKYLMSRFFDALLKIDDLGLCPTDDQYEAIQRGDYWLKMIDINYSWMLPSQAHVISWLRSAGLTARLKHRGSGQFTGDTLYFAKNSRRWAVKGYSKGQEIGTKKHGLPKELAHPELIEWASKALRIELRIHSMELKKMLHDTGTIWTQNTAKLLFESFVLKNLEITDNMPVPDEILPTLPPKMRLLYQSWIAGDDLRQILPRPTFYRYRKQMLEFGIDISIVQAAQRNNIIPLIRYLEAVPAEIPQWAYEKGLVA